MKDRLEKVQRLVGDTLAQLEEILFDAEENKFSDDFQSATEEASQAAGYLQDAITEALEAL